LDHYLNYLSPGDRVTITVEIQLTGCDGRSRGHTVSTNSAVC